MTAKKVTDAKGVESITYSYIFYTDGGAAPTNPGPAGIGIHGYQYTSEVPKKGSGNSDYILTKKGYVSKEKNTGATPVTPIQYFDCNGGFAEYQTNNFAELKAIIHCFKIILETPLKENEKNATVLILGDSRYAIDGANKYLSSWKKNGWKKSTDEVIANVNVWKEFDALLETIRSKGIAVTFDWVKAHTDEIGEGDKIIGNILADRLATVGVNRSLRNFNANTPETFFDILISPSEKYWKLDVEKNPLITQKAMLFNTERDNLNTGIYCLCDVEKDLDLMGKRIADGAFSVVVLNEPDPMLETMLGYYKEHKPELESLIVLKLDKLFKPTVYNDIMRYKENAFYTHPKKNPNDLLTLDDEDLARELYPPLIASRAITELDNLYKLLLDTVSGVEGYVYTDITPLIYESVEKKVKKEIVTEQVLRAEHKSGIFCLTTKINYQDTEGIGSISIPLVFSIDLPDRNTLKRLETHQPRVSIVTWLVSPGVFRYATIIQSGLGMGIWAGVYSNTHFIKPKNG